MSINLGESNTTTQPPIESEETQQPKTMGNERPKDSQFEWFRQFPKFNFPQPNQTFVLINDEELQEIFKTKNIDSQSVEAERVRRDIRVLNEELMPIFRERDYVAKQEQNRYRLYQLSFLSLATAATGVGSLQVWALQSAPEWILVFGLIETVIALLTTFIATLMGNKQPLGEWLDNRSLAESLRREYYRYLADAEPYHQLDGVKRETHLALRAAAINNRKDPNSVAVVAGGYNG